MAKSSRNDRACRNARTPRKVRTPEEAKRRKAAAELKAAMELAEAQALEDEEEEPSIEEALFSGEYPRQIAAIDKLVDQGDVRSLIGLLRYDEKDDGGWGENEVCMLALRGLYYLGPLARSARQSIFELMARTCGPAWKNRGNEVWVLRWGMLLDQCIDTLEQIAPQSLVSWTKRLERRTILLRDCHATLSAARKLKQLLQDGGFRYQTDRAAVPHTLVKSLLDCVRTRSK